MRILRITRSRLLTLQVCTQEWNFFSTAEGRCVDCPSPGARIGIAVGCIIFLAALVGYLSWLHRTRHPKVKRQTHRFRLAMRFIRHTARNIGIVPKIKIALSFFQVASVS